MPGRKGPVEIPQEFEVLFRITTRLEYATNAHLLAAVIDESEHDRNVCLDRDAIETGLPVLGPSARSLGRECEIETLAVVSSSP